ncbi:hypothetical protein QCN29_14845 [Streptomyces sp. HNM0663]|uniref:Uncharacterized protein n=1 Tax=Streptomyces chengmaiensis TaxID=3040919 RepID=A0ABT6HMW4_9ACTN|nr:hypothetical protein [Streptomyces chengmaiensis]MDH2390045.1 hypothetical protein [Streptomyces chengmaiensis]
MREALDATSKAEVEEISSRIELSDDIVLAFIRDRALVPLREQARRKPLGSDEELPGSAAVLTVSSKSSPEPGA